MNWQILSTSEFETFKQEWDSLNARIGNNPLLDSKFVVPLLRYFGTEQEKLAVCTLNGEVCCIAIVVKVRSGVWETFQPSQAPIGCWVQAAELPVSKLGQSLREALPGNNLLFGITQQDPSLSSRPEASPRIRTIDYIDTARVVVDGTFEDYWSKRGKNLRQNLRRQRNRLGREEVETKLVLVQEPASIHEAVERYGILESAGWKSESDTAIHIENAQGRFYSEMLMNFAETGQAIVFQYTYNDELTATDLCILGGGSIIILKTTYDEAITTSSPAMLMREDAFNHIFSNKLAQQIEFYGKVMDWHTRWAGDIRTMYHINIYSLLGQLINTVRGK